MSIASSIRAARNVLKRYGFKTFFKQTVLKLKKHNFEKAGLFLSREQIMPVPSFLGRKRMIKGLVTVVIPCYNHESFIKEALMSIYKQDYKDIEIIVVDDCSSDDSPNIIQNLFEEWKKEKRFKNQKFVIHKENKGAHYSIDEAINLGAGEYFAVLNSDDKYDTNRFSVLVDLVEKGNAGLAFSKVAVIDEKGMLKQNTPFSALQKNIEKKHMFLGLCADNLAISSGNLFFKREIVEKIGLFRDFKYIHDWDFLMRSALTKKVVYCEGTTYYYRMHSTNSYLELVGNTELCDEEMVEMRSRVFAVVYEKPISGFYSEEDYPKIVDLLYRRLINNLR